jgi:hypothetical protein
MVGAARAEAAVCSHVTGGAGAPPPALAAAGRQAGPRARRAHAPGANRAREWSEGSSLLTEARLGSWLGSVRVVTGELKGPGRTRGAALCLACRLKGEWLGRSTAVRNLDVGVREGEFEYGGVGPTRTRRTAAAARCAPLGRERGSRGCIERKREGYLHTSVVRTLLKAGAGAVGSLLPGAGLGGRRGRRSCGSWRRRRRRWRLRPTHSRRCCRTPPPPLCCCAPSPQVREHHTLSPLVPRRANTFNLGQLDIEQPAAVTCISLP